MKTETMKYLEAFFEEKDIDRERIFEHTVDGVMVIVECGAVIDGIFATGHEEQVQIANTLRAIDFRNGDVYHYLNHLAGALAQMQAKSNPMFAS